MSPKQPRPELKLRARLFSSENSVCDGKSVYQFQIPNITVYDKGIIRIVHDKSWFAAVWFLDMFFLHIVNLYFFSAAHAGIVSREPAGVLEYGIGHLLARGFDDDMGAGGVFDMEPPVVACGKMEGELVILQIVFSHIHMIAIAGEIMERRVFYFHLLFGKFPAHIAGADELFLDFGQVVLGKSDIQGSLYGFQVEDIIFCLLA